MKDHGSVQIYWNTSQDNNTEIYIGTYLLLLKLSNSLEIQNLPTTQRFCTIAKGKFHLIPGLLRIFFHFKWIKMTAFATIISAPADHPALGRKRIRIFQILCQTMPEKFFLCLEILLFRRIPPRSGNRRPRVLCFPASKSRIILLFSFQDFIVLLEIPMPFIYEISTRGVEISMESERISESRTGFDRCWHWHFSRHHRNRGCFEILWEI